VGEDNVGYAGVEEKKKRGLAKECLGKFQGLPGANGTAGAKKRRRGSQFEHRGENVWESGEVFHLSPTIALRARSDRGDISSGRKRTGALPSKPERTHIGSKSQEKCEQGWS